MTTEWAAISRAVGSVATNLRCTSGQTPTTLGQIGCWSRHLDQRSRGLDITAYPWATRAECTTTSDFFIAKPPMISAHTGTRRGAGGWHRYRSSAGRDPVTVVRRRSSRGGFRPAHALRRGADRSTQRDQIADNRLATSTAFWLIANSRADEATSARIRRWLRADRNRDTGQWCGRLRFSTRSPRVQNERLSDPRRFTAT